MKKHIILSLAVLLLSFILVSCASSEPAEKPEMSIQYISRCDRWEADIYRINKASARGYNISAYLVVPDVIEYSHLFLYPKKNGEAINIEDFDNVVYETVKSSSGYVNIARKLKAVVLCPVLPQDEKHEYIRLSYYLNDTGKYKRLDLQVKALIEDTMSYLSGMGIELNNSVLAGYSGEAQFCVHFAILHPEMVEAVAAGGVCCPILPVSSVRGETLNYPVGLNDFREVTGKKFDYESWKHIRFFLTTGRNDDRGINFKSEFIYRNSSWTGSFVSIWNVFAEEYTKRSPGAQMVMYENLGHEPVHEDEYSFLKDNEFGFSPITISLPATVRTSKTSN